jgi:hypothetical protein
MLPSRIRYWLFDKLSVQTMRYVSAVPTRKAKGLTKKIYDMIREDFFKNGSLTSRSKVPELMAAIWTGGRESMLVADKIDRTTKDAISAVLSQINDCPYCEDMLISLVHAGGDHEAANDIFVQNDFDASDETLRQRLEWVRAVATPGNDQIPDTPFTEEQLPEVIGTLMGMSDINRFSHVVMEDSPVAAPFGMQSVKAWALKMFGSELKVTRQVGDATGATRARARFGTSACGRVACRHAVGKAQPQGSGRCCSVGSCRRARRRQGRFVKVQKGDRRFVESVEWRTDADR